MDPITQARINSQMMETLAELLARAVRDPRLELVTLTGVEVTNDLAVAKVFYSLMGGEQEKLQAQRGLENAAGFLRREIGRRMHVRNAPQLRFHFDTSLETGQRIETLLRELRDGKPAEGGEEES